MYKFTLITKLLTIDIYIIVVVSWLHGYYVITLEYNKNHNDKNKHI